MDILDFYGTSYNLNTLGKSSFKTWLSFSSSFLTVAVVAVSTWLIGKDFFYKTNPKVINSTVIPEVSEPIYINNRNFTVALREEGFDGRPLEEDKLFAFPHIRYEIYQRDDNGSPFPLFSRIYDLVPCLETEAKENKEMEQYNLATLKCLDMERIKKDIEAKLGVEREHDLELYGRYDEKYSSVIFLIYSNCKYKDGEIDESTCVSFDEAVERSKTPQFLSMFVPRVNFSPENYENPLRTYYENVGYKFSPYNEVVYSLKYSLFKLDDDRGWVFENIDQTIMLDLSEQGRGYGFLTKEAFSSNSANPLVILLESDRKQIIVKRMFLKLQELAANVGGMIKLVFLVFGFTNKIYSKYRIERVLVEKYTDGNAVQVNSASFEEINSSTNNKPKISFIDYLKIQIKCTKSIKPKKAMIENIRSKLDIESLIKLCSVKGEESNLEQNRVRFENRLAK